MTTHYDAIRSLQCPNCGSPVEGTNEGEVVSCSYCGTLLKVSMSASGYLIGRITSIDDSTAFLARTEALKLIQERLLFIDALINQVIVSLQGLDDWRMKLLKMQERIHTFESVLFSSNEYKKEKIVNITLTIVTISLLIMFIYGLFVGGLRPIDILPFLFVYFVFFLMKILRKADKKADYDLMKRDLEKLEYHRDEKERRYQDLKDQIRELEEERNRLIRREIELTASLDELAERL
jgi:hypothetical protein